ncbi:MAG: response regulator [Alphaproteobacteria bacterium]
MTQPTLLLVEDDPFDVLAMKRCVATYDLPVRLECAGDGEDALARLNRLLAEPHPAPVFVLLDLNMPRMNGIEFLDALRADLRLARTVVYPLTTSNDVRDRRATYARGVAGYICKDAITPDYSDLAGLIRHLVDLVILPEPGRP